MTMETENVLRQISHKMDRLIESNLKLADAIAAQTMAIHALAASNEQMTDLIANAAVEDAPADGMGKATSLDQVEAVADRSTF